MEADEKQAGASGFKLLFVTLSMILLAFFILLNSMAVIDSSRKKKALGSLLGSFGILDGAMGIESESKHIDKTDSIIGTRNTTVFKEIVKESEILAMRLKAGDEDITVRFDKQTGDIRIIVAEKLLFTSGTSAISPKTFAFLDRLADIARKNRAKVVVTGHTDNTPVAQGQSSNWKLSIERGVTVARYIKNVERFSIGMVIAGGASHYRPRNINRTKKGKAANRRVEILVQPEKGASL